MTLEYYTLSISIISIIIASSSLFWNIYKDILLKPFSRITAQISYIKHAGQDSGPFVNLKLLNLGPGKIIIQSIVMKRSSFLKRIMKKVDFWTIIHDYENVYNPQMPTEVEIHSSTTQMLPYDKDSFLNTNITHIGFIDSIGRYHWVNKKDFKRINSSYQKDYT